MYFALRIHRCCLHSAAILLATWRQKKHVFISSSGAGVEARDFAEPPPKRGRWFVSDCRWFVSDCRQNNATCRRFSGCRNLNCVFSFLFWLLLVDGSCVKADLLSVVRFSSLSVCCLFVLFFVRYRDKDFRTHAYAEEVVVFQILRIEFHNSTAQPAACRRFKTLFLSFPDSLN